MSVFSARCKKSQWILRAAPMTPSRTAPWSRKMWERQDGNCIPRACSRTFYLSSQVGKEAKRLPKVKGWGIGNTNKQKKTCPGRDGSLVAGEISADPQQTRVVYLPLSQRLDRPWITSYRLLCTALSPSLHPQVYQGLYSPVLPGRRAVMKLEWKTVGSFLVADFVWFSVSLNKWSAMSRTRINQSFETKNRSICFKNLVSYILTTLSKSNGTNIKINSVSYNLLTSLFLLEIKSCYTSKAAQKNVHAPASASWVLGL